jgi:hypothetical protein
MLTADSSLEELSDNQNNNRSNVADFNLATNVQLVGSTVKERNGEKHLATGVGTTLTTTLTTQRQPSPDGK